MEHSHYHLERRTVLFGVHVDGDTASVILYDDGVVGADSHLDVGAIACKCLVDGVVHGFVNQVVQALFTDVANIHGGALAHGLQAFEHLNVTGAVCRSAFLFKIFHYRDYE